MIRLMMRIGDDPALREFADETITIGRADSNHVALRDHRISRLHARIEWDGEEVRICDLQSGNGTYLNGRKLRSGVLKAGDLLMIGPVRLTLVHLEAADMPPSPVTLPVPTEKDGSTVLVPGSLLPVAPERALGPSRLRRRARPLTTRARD